MQQLRKYRCQGGWQCHRLISSGNMPMRPYAGPTRSKNLEEKEALYALARTWLEASVQRYRFRREEQSASRAARKSTDASLRLVRNRCRKLNVNLIVICVPPPAAASDRPAGVIHRLGWPQPFPSGGTKLPSRR
jgi:hypothetical protein